MPPKKKKKPEVHQVTSSYIMDAEFADETSNRPHSKVHRLIYDGGKPNCAVAAFNNINQQSLITPALLQQGRVSSREFSSPPERLSELNDCVSILVRLGLIGGPAIGNTNSTNEMWTFTNEAMSYNDSGRRISNLSQYIQENPNENIRTVEGGPVYHTFGGTERDRTRFDEVKDISKVSYIVCFLSQIILYTNSLFISGNYTY